MKRALDFIDIDVIADTKLFIDPSALLYLNNDFGNNCVLLIQNFFSKVLSYIKEGKSRKAIDLLNMCKEPNETHLGLSTVISRGTALGEGFSNNIWNALTESAAVSSGLIQDLEDTILLIPGISDDRISDIATNIIRSELIIYTQYVCSSLEIPTKPVNSGPIWDPEKQKWYSERTQLPFYDDQKLLFVPKSIARRSMHYSADTYYRHSIIEHFRVMELNANTSLVHLVRDNTKRRIYIKDLKEKYPGGKQNIQKYTTENPTLLVSFREDRKSNLPGPMDNFQLSESLNIPPPQYQNLISEIRTIPSGEESIICYETAIEKYFSLVFYPSLTFPKKQNQIFGEREITTVAYSNTAKSGFFKTLTERNQSQLILVKCTNHSIDSNNLELIYLSEKFSSTPGQLGLLICRGIDNKQTLEHRCKEIALNGRGLILCLDDDDLEVIASQEFSGHEHFAWSRGFLK